MISLTSKIITGNYYATFFFTLLIRDTINAVTVICYSQASRRAGPNWTGTLLIYGQHQFFPKILPSVSGVPKF